MRWLAECSAVALGEALRVVAPELSGGPVTVPVPDPAVKGDPLWWSSSAVVCERFIVKFAWSRPAALRLAHEIGVLTALTREPRVPFLPEVVASSTDPVLLITRFVPGASLFEVISSIDPDQAGRQLAGFLAALHDRSARQRAEVVVGELGGVWLPPATTQTLRERFGRWARPGRHLSTDRVMAWHLRTALDDALWRSEAGIPLTDHRTPPERADDLAARFTMLGIDPEAPFLVG